MKNFVLVAILCLVTINALSQGTTPAHEEGGWAIDIYAVLSGFPVTWSSKHAGWKYDSARIDDPDQCWSPRKKQSGEWIQVSSIRPVKWSGVVIQGCNAWRGYVETFKVSYSNDGVNWHEVDDGKVFNGNNDNDGHHKIWFQSPVKATTMRLSPLSWNRWPVLRFDFIILGTEPKN